ncbi:GntR family transcriptional regulator [Lysinibacillus xylanilyticus]|uniref:GntR family transcriptional regulator n=1 Tax=Lysinibacillus xylanilyticus TaxID=582475 RepID=UPI00381B0B19
MRNNVYEIIKTAIITGELSPRGKLKDKAPSEKLGISRTPIREALLKLEDEDFIISKPHSCTMVAPINIIEVKEIYSIVIALETFAIRGALLINDIQKIKELEIINTNYKNSIEEGNSKNCLKYDMEFHSYIVSMSNNQE